MTVTPPRASDDSSRTSAMVETASRPEVVRVPPTAAASARPRSPFCRLGAQCARRGSRPAQTARGASRRGPAARRARGPT
eukprot:scaffold133706_cov102-Phaeocystis_antarctica.AAC.1